MKNKKFSLRTAFVRKKWIPKVKTLAFFGLNCRRVIKFYRLCKKIKLLFEPRILVRLPCV